jgi:hypothetical protein
MQVPEKGDFDWALGSSAAVGQKTGSHWTRVAVSLGCADPLCPWILRYWTEAPFIRCVSAVVAFEARLSPIDAVE